MIDSDINVTLILAMSYKKCVMCFWFKWHLPMVLDFYCVDT